MSTAQIAFDLARVVVAAIGLTVAAYQVAATDPPMPFERDEGR